MSFYCINTEPVQEEIPEDMRYIFITKEYPKPEPPEGKKKCTKEQNEQYNDMLCKRSEMFSMLDSGHYDVGNSLIPVRSFTYDLSDLFNKENSIIYKIRPINSCKKRERYSNRDEYYVSKFDIEKKIENMCELIDDLSSSIFYADLFHFIFDKGYYANDGYKECVMNLFKYAHEKYPDKKIYLGDCIRSVLHTYDHGGRYNNEPKREEYVCELLNDNLIELLQEYEDHEAVVKNLIFACWFGICVKYIESMSEDVCNIYLRDVGNNESVMDILRKNNDKEDVNKIISLLDIENVCVTLTVLSDDDWDDEQTKETKIFKDMNEVRGYVISKYKVPFENACKDVEYWRGKDDELFRIS